MMSPHWTPPSLHFAQGIDSQLGVAVNDVPGAGAAGGIGAALKGFLNAEFRPGIAIVIEQSGLDAAAPMG